MTTTMGIMQRVSSCLTGFRVLSCGFFGFEVCMMSTDILFMMKMMSKSVRGDCGDVAAMTIRGTVCLFVTFLVFQLIAMMIRSV